MSIKGKTGRTLDELEEQQQAYLAWVMSFSLALSQVITQFLFGTDGLNLGGSYYTAERAQGGIAGTVITMVVVAVVGIVGILIYSQVDDSISVSGDLSSSSAALTSNFGDAAELIGIVLIVLIASLVIAVIQRFR